jgi:hypothetical protein
VSPLALATALLLAAADAPAGRPASAAQPSQSDSGLVALDLSSLPPEQQARWPLVVQKCGRCHSMDVALHHAYTPAEWKASMRRMVRIPGAGITAQQSAEILDFLRSYSTRPARR